MKKIAIALLVSSVLLTTGSLILLGYWIRVHNIEFIVLLSIVSAVNIFINLPMGIKFFADEVIRGKD